MNNKISCSHLLSSLTLYCSYRLRFFAFRDHLWDDNSLPQLQSSWLRSTRGSRRSKYTEGVARRTATRRSRPSQACTRGGPALFITKLMMTLRLSPILYATFPQCMPEFVPRPVFYLRVVLKLALA